MAFWTLYKREFNSYFQSAVAYIVLFGSALIQGFFFITLVHFVMDANYKDQSVMQIFFQWPLFWFLLIVQVPLTTMRVFSEEIGAVGSSESQDKTQSSAPRSKQLSVPKFPSKAPRRSSSASKRH